jgi:drug/metabolite transporter (DMT)-like permease
MGRKNASPNPHRAPLPRCVLDASPLHRYKRSRGKSTFWICPVTLAAIGLLVASSITHALWNLAGKRDQPTPAYFLAANTLGALAFAWVLIPTARSIPWFPPGLWLLIALTGIFQTGYYSALAGTYRSGDLSVSYPIARAAAVLFIGIVNTMLGNGHGPSPLAWAGMVCIAAGILLLPLERFSGFSFSRYTHKSTLLALGAAVCTVGYSMADSRALSILSTMPDPPWGRTGITLLYSVLEALSTSVWLAILVVAAPRQRLAAREVMTKGIWRTVLTGATIFFTYTLVLFAMYLARDVRDRKSVV